MAHHKLQIQLAEGSRNVVMECLSRCSRETTSSEDETKPYVDHFLLEKGKEVDVVLEGAA